MTYNVFGGTLSLTQSINQKVKGHGHDERPNIVRKYLWEF